MKRILKILIISSLFMILLSPCAFALESNIDQYAEEFDYEQIFDSVNDETLTILEEIGLTEISAESIFAIEPQKIFNALFNIASMAVKKPAGFTVSALGILFLTAALSSFVGKSDVLGFVGSSALALTVAVPVAELVATAFSVLEALLLFTTSFAGVFSAIVSSSGNVSAGVSYSYSTVFINTVLSGVLVNLSQPVVNAMCSLGFLSCFDIYFYTSRFSGIVKKIYVFILSLAGTIFSGIVTLKSVISSGVDSLSSRGVQFVIGQSLPIVGGAVSETYSTLMSSLNLIKNTVGVFGIITVVVFVLPTLFELLMWILSLEIIRNTAEAVGVENSMGLISILKDSLVLLVSTIVILTAVFVVSVGVCITVKGGAV